MYHQFINPSNSIQCSKFKQVLNLSYPVIFLKFNGSWAHECDLGLTGSVITSHSNVVLCSARVLFKQSSFHPLINPQVFTACVIRPYCAICWPLLSTSSEVPVKTKINLNCSLYTLVQTEIYSTWKKMFKITLKNFIFHENQGSNESVDIRLSFKNILKLSAFSLMQLAHRLRLIQNFPLSISENERSHVGPSCYITLVCPLWS